MKEHGSTKMEILDAIADMDPVYQQQMRQLAEKEKKFDKMVATLQAAMTTTQLITATIGTIVAFGIYKLETRNAK